ncbi:MAG: NAD-dependent epimerase/dehydratase family protein, partial [Polyangiaceae bacterium]
MTKRPPKKKHPSSRPAPPESALVLGATGQIGSAVVRELLSRGTRVTAASRRAAPTANLAGLDITFSPGDADDPAQVDRWTEGHDLVVDAAVPYPLWLFRPETPAEAAPHDYASARTDRILAAARRHRTTLAVVGSFTTLPHPGEARGDIEPAILRRSHPYFAVKEAVESRVLAAASDGLSALIVNPVAVLGPWDGKPREHTFLPELLSGRVPLTSSREASFIDVRDVASALCAAVWAGRTAEKIPLAGHTVRIGDMMDLACSLHGTRPPRVPGST